MKIDFSSSFANFFGGLRTSSALLVGNSVLIYYGVLGTMINDPMKVGIQIFAIGTIGLIITSITKRKLA